MRPSIRYRKKPGVVEAMRWDGSRASAEQVCRWVNDRPIEHGEPTMSYVFTTADDIQDVQIWTLDGLFAVSPGDFIICDVDEEFHLCKPGMFAATHEPIAQSEESPR